MRRAGLLLALALAGCARPELAPVLPSAADAEPGLVARFRDARALGIAADRVYVVDAGAASVVILPGDGLPAIRLGGPGTGAGAFLAPADVDPTNGLAVYVADAGAGTVQRFTAEGRVAETVPVPEVDPSLPARTSASGGGRGQPVAVASGPGGVLYVAEAGRGVVLRLDADRAVVRVLGGPGAGAAALVEPVGIAVADDGTVWVADAGRGVVQGFDPFGAALRAIPGGAVGGVAAVALAGRQVLVVGPRGVALVGAGGGLDRVILLERDEAIVDAALVGGDLLVLTRTRLLRQAVPAATALRCCMKVPSSS